MLTRIMEALDVVKNIGPRPTSILIVLSVNSLAFERAEEAFGSGIVCTRSDCTHRAGQVMTFEEAVVFVTGKLTAPIGMQDPGSLPLRCHSAIRTA